MANEGMTLSSQGRASLRLREGVSKTYYNDQANNCTFGVGTLLHAGPCTPQELATIVADADIDAALSERVSTAEAAVRAGVPNRQLTQDQFDALVSFVYNVGATGARAALQTANSSDDGETARHMGENVVVHTRDAQGRRGPPIRSQGLANRRKEEAAPFQRRAPQ